jgi:acyl-CoA synthetase (NDP forming)
VLVVQRDLTPMHRVVFDQMKVAAPAVGKPFVLISEMTSHWRDVPPELGVYVTASLHDGLHAMSHLAAYAAYRRSLTSRANAKSIRPFAIPRPVGRTVLTEFESKLLLAQAGFPVTRETMVQTADEAVAAATAIGFPVALKVQSPDLMHKTDAGGLALGLGDATDVRQAFARLAGSVCESGAPRIDGWLVQEMISGGVELLLGMHRDPALGPVIVLSPGGIFVELFEKSSTIRLPPFGPDQADGMIQQSVPIQRLLAGFRGRPPADRAALMQLICKFADLVAGLDEQTVAIDLNPMIVLPGSSGVKIVDASIEFARN